MAEALLEVKDLSVHFPTDDGLVKAVDGVSFTLLGGDARRRRRVGLGQERVVPDGDGPDPRKQAQIEGEIMFRVRTC